MKELQPKCKRNTVEHFGVQKSAGDKKVKITLSIISNTDPTIG